MPAMTSSSQRIPSMKPRCRALPPPPREGAVDEPGGKHRSEHGAAERTREPSRDEPRREDREKARREERDDAERGDARGRARPRGTRREGGPRFPRERAPTRRGVREAWRRGRTAEPRASPPRPSGRGRGGRSRTRGRERAVSGRQRCGLTRRPFSPHPLPASWPPPTPPATSPSSKGSSPSASAPACTSAASTRGASTTSSTRSSTTPIDEVINGYATRLEVTLFADGREIEVTDNGRGIPVDVHPKYKKTALELILTTLHAGGKFEQGNYVHSGGLHGVGSSVVCALSSEMTVTVSATATSGSRPTRRGRRPRRSRRSRAARRCAARGRRSASGPTPRSSGSSPSTRRRSATGSRPRRTSTAGCASSSSDETKKPAVREELSHDGGLADCLTKVVAAAREGRDARGRASSSIARTPTRASSSRSSVDRGDRRARPVVRERHPDAVGRHARERPAGPASSKAVRNYVETHELLPKGVSRHGGGHPRGHRRAPLGLRPRAAVPGPDEGPAEQPRDGRGQVDGAVRPALEKWLNENPTLAEQIVGRIVLAARAREASAPRRSR